MHSEQSGLGAIVPWQALVNAELSAFTRDHSRLAEALGREERLTSALERDVLRQRTATGIAQACHGKLTTICWFMRRTRRQEHVAEAEAQERFWRQCQAGSAADPCYPHTLIMLKGGGLR